MVVGRHIAEISLLEDGLRLVYLVLRRYTTIAKSAAGPIVKMPVPTVAVVRARSRWAFASSAHAASSESMVSRRASPIAAKPGTQSVGNATRTSANWPAWTRGAVRVTTGLATSPSSSTTLPSSGPWPHERKLASSVPVVAGVPQKPPRTSRSTRRPRHPPPTRDR